MFYFKVQNKNKNIKIPQLQILSLYTTILKTKLNSVLRQAPKYTYFEKNSFGE